MPLCMYVMYVAQCAIYSARIPNVQYTNVLLSQLWQLPFLWAYFQTVIGVSCDEVLQAFPHARLI